MRLVRLLESLDNPFSWKNTFKTEQVDREDEEDGNTYMKEIFQPVQIVQFATDSGVPYVWYARQNRYEDSMWEIAFGKRTGETLGGGHQLDIGVTGDGDAMRVFATVLEITNAFVEYDENFEVQRLVVSAKGNNRTKLYLKRLLPRIEQFKVTEQYPDGDEVRIHLERQ